VGETCQGLKNLPARHSEAEEGLPAVVCEGGAEFVKGKVKVKAEVEGVKIGE